MRLYREHKENVKPAQDRASCVLVKDKDKDKDKDKNMTMRIAYELLQELGGRASMKDLIILCKQKYPNDTYHKYGLLSTRMSRLRNWGIVSRDQKNNWVITGEWPAAR